MKNKRFIVKTITIPGKKIFGITIKKEEVHECVYDTKTKSLNPPSSSAFKDCEIMNNYYEAPKFRIFQKTDDKKFYIFIKKRGVTFSKYQNIYRSLTIPSNIEISDERGIVYRIFDDSYTDIDCGFYKRFLIKTYGRYTKEECEKRIEEMEKWLEEMELEEKRKSEVTYIPV